MRRLTAWIGGVAGGVVAYRFWRRHSEAESEPSPEPAPPEPDARAEELRTKLAESRDAEPVAESAVEEPPAAERVEPEEAEPTEPESPDERRSRVHDEGRAAIDEMKSE